jgi:hypothetical protein
MARFMVRAAIVVGIVTAGFAAQPAMAQRGVSATANPSAGSAQRRAILDALRPAIERRLGGNVEFVVNRIRVVNGWALVIAEPQRRGGGRINPRQYFSADDLQAMDGLTINAVLRYQGGRWRLVDHAIGPTDVWYCNPAFPRALTGC